MAESATNLNSNLKIGVEVQATKALKELAKLINVVGKVKDEASGTQKEVTKASNTFKALTSSSHKAQVALSKVASSMGRITFYRAIRSVIKGITQAFVDGVNNIYNYSNAMGGTFASTMDEMASSYLYFKNNLGAMASQLVSAVAPALNTIMNLASQAVDAIAQVFAVLGGKTTYSKALPTATKYSGAIADDMASASGSAKELKATLLGIDEINRLDDNSSSGGGGGSSSGGLTDYTSMFEEAPISDKIKEWAKKFGEIKTIALEIASCLLAWKIGSSVIKALDAFGLLKNGELEKLTQGFTSIVAGLTMMITGITIELSGGYSIGYDGLNLQNAIKTAIGMALTTGGGGLVGSGIAILAGGSVATGGLIGIAVGAMLAISVLTVTLAMGQAKADVEGYREALIGTSESYNAMVTASDECTTALEKSREAFAIMNESIAEYQEIVLKTENAKTLVDEIYDMVDAGIQNNEQLKLLQTKIGVVNSLKLDGLHLEYNTLTNEMNLTRDACQEVIDKIIEQAQTQHYIDMMTEAVNARTEAEVAMTKASNEYTTASEAMKEAEAILYEHTVLNKDALWGMTEEGLKTKQMIQDSQEQMRKATADWSEANAQYVTATESLNAVKDAMGDVNKTSVDSKYMEFIGIQNNASNATNSILAIAYAIDAVNARSIHSTDVISHGGRIDWGHDGLVLKNGGMIPKFAGGGFTSAQLFIANENSTPELVGNIGTRTGVANTSQMVEAMASGVYQANAEQNALIREQNTLLKAILEKDSGGISVNDITNALSRQQRVMGRAV